MKKALTLSTIFIMVLSLFVLSCRKDFDEYFNENSPDKTVLEDAKIFFASHAIMTSYPKDGNERLMSKNGRQNKVFIKLSPLWKKAKTIQRKSEEFIVVPTLDVKFENKKYNIIRVFLFKRKNNVIKSGEIIEVISQVGSNADFDEVIKQFDQERIDQFTGVVLKYDINYFLLESRYYKDGIKEHKLGKIQSFESSKNGAEIKGNGTESNEQQCTAFYLITDIYYSDGSYEQTREYLNTVCWDIPGGCTADCSVYDGGGGSAGGNSSNVTNNTVEPCLKNSVDFALSANVSNAITAYMYSTFGSYSQKNLNFVSGALPTSRYADTEGSWSNLTVTLNNQNLPGYSKEFQVAVIFHEILHAYLIAAYGPATNGHLNIPNQHEYMITNYVNTVTNALTTTFPNLSSGDATGLALIGLQNTSLYTLFSPAQVQSTQNSQQAYMGTNADTKKGTYCN